MGAHGFFPGRDIELGSNVAPSVAATGFGSYKSEVRITGRLGTGYRRREVPAPAIVASGEAQTRFLIERDGQSRKFTIAELRLICGFPDDFILTGSYAEQWVRLGNAVPPPMMAAVAREVRDRILKVR
jgi:site-specific DNA-cytosine methylase